MMAAYLANKLEPLNSTNIPLPPLLDLRENPRLNQRASRNHNAVYAALLNARPVALRGESVTTTKDGDAGN